MADWPLRLASGEEEEEAAEAVEAEVEASSSDIGCLTERECVCDEMGERFKIEKEECEISHTFDDRSERNT